MNLYICRICCSQGRQGNHFCFQKSFPLLKTNLVINPEFKHIFFTMLKDPMLDAEAAGHGTKTGRFTLGNVLAFSFGAAASFGLVHFLVEQGSFGGGDTEQALVGNEQAYSYEFQFDPFVERFCAEAGDWCPYEEGVNGQCVPAVWDPWQQDQKGWVCEPLPTLSDSTCHKTGDNCTKNGVSGTCECLPVHHWCFCRITQGLVIFLLLI